MSAKKEKDKRPDSVIFTEKEMNKPISGKDPIKDKNISKQYDLIKDDSSSRDTSPKRRP